MYIKPIIRIDQAMYKVFDCLTDELSGKRVSLTLSPSDFAVLSEERQQCVERALNCYAALQGDLSVAVKGYREGAPNKFDKYTPLVIVDYDVEDKDERGGEIPLENRVALLTESVAEWFVKRGVGEGKRLMADQASLQGVKQGHHAYGQQTLSDESKGALKAIANMTDREIPPLLLVALHFWVYEGNQDKKAVIKEKIMNDYPELSDKKCQALYEVLVQVPNFSHHMSGRSEEELKKSFTDRLPTIKAELFG